MQRVVDPSDVDPKSVEEYEVVGFGSGIYGMSFDPELRRFVASLPHAENKQAFVFATAGSGRVIELPIRAPLAKLVATAGYRLLGTFCCPGFDTWLPLRLIGGLNKGRPNEADLEHAHDFCRDTCARARREDHAEVHDEIVSNVLLR